MRTCRRRVLRRAAFLNVAIGWLEFQRGRGLDDDDPAGPLIRLLDDEESLQDQRSPTIDDVLSAVSAGAVAAKVDDWIDRAATAHLLGGRFTGFQVTDVVSDERVLPAGEGATVWVYDRLTKTYLDSWSRASLEWELAYAHKPVRVRQSLGDVGYVLHEREVPLRDVLDEISRRLLGDGAAGDPVDGMTAGEVIESVLQLIRIGSLSDARDLAPRASRRAPGNTMLVVAHGFCLMPIDAQEATRVLRRLRNVPSVRRLPGVAVEIDLATLALKRSDLNEFDHLVREVEAKGAIEGWFWDPVSLIWGEATVRHFELAEWLSRAAEARTLSAERAKAAARVVPSFDE